MLCAVRLLQTDSAVTKQYLDCMQTTITTLRESPRPRQQIEFSKITTQTKTSQTGVVYVFNIFKVKGQVLCDKCSQSLNREFKVE